MTDLISSIPADCPGDGEGPGVAPCPTFLIVGVEKAGTTALYHFLSAHPDVFMSAHKEPGYFARRRGGPRTVRTWEAYLALFAGAGGAKAIGEATPYYFQDPEAPRRIDEALPGVRIVILLRHPVERARSHYVMLTNSRPQVEPEPFASFFRRHQAGAASWKDGDMALRGLSFSFYADALARWLGRFGRDRVKVLLAEDLRAEPERTLREVYAFLGADPAFVPDVTRRYNEGRALPRSGAVQRLVFQPSALKTLARGLLPERLRVVGRQTLLRLNQGSRARLSDAERAEFAAVYHDDVRRVERLLDRDLSAWLR